MIHRAVLVVTVLACVVSLLGCASATAAPQGSSAPAAPAKGRTPLPLPPQPTSPPPPTGISSGPYQSPAPAAIVSGPTPAPKSTAVAPSPQPTTAAATVQPTATKSATTAVAAAPGAATGRRTEAKFTFTPALATIEEVDPLEQTLKKIPGIFEVSATQTSATVNYDAGLITVEQIILAFAQQGHPVKPQ